ncbi:MAG: hypothetical protein K0Q79_3122 [Flavipsychrobacter sp.]|jgi:hypothetical protein|nr:hypothetical protein [Flavipsychrobacter sp.]
MKKVSLSLLLLLPLIALAQDEPVAEQKSGVDIGAILFVVGLIVFIIVVRKIYESKNRKAYEKEQEEKRNAVREDFNNPKYWYQCKNCKVTIRKTIPPNAADCFKAVDHLWTQIAEVGNTKYLCRNCNTLVETKAEPVAENCPDAAIHDWERLG